jgi:hypothetical protein
MKLRYVAPKGRRFKKTKMFGMTHYKVKGVGESFTYVEPLDRFVPYRLTNRYVRSHKDCNSVRAFRRHLRKLQGKVPSGTIFSLDCRIHSCDILGKVK